MCGKKNKPTHGDVLSPKQGGRIPPAPPLRSHSPRVSRHSFFRADCLLGQSVAILFSARTTMASILAPRGCDAPFARSLPCPSLPSPLESPDFRSKSQRNGSSDRNLLCSSATARVDGTGVNLATQRGSASFALAVNYGSPQSLRKLAATWGPGRLAPPLTQSLPSLGPRPTNSPATACVCCARRTLTGFQGVSR